MTLLITGIVVFVVTGIIFWMCLPSGEKTHRLTNTEYEPYVGVAFTAAIALGFTLTLSGILGMMG